MNKLPIETAIAEGKAFYVSAEGPLVAPCATSCRIFAGVLCDHLISRKLKAVIYTSAEVAAAKEAHRNKIAAQKEAK